MKNLSDGLDYSPVVLQYGRAVESELMEFFNEFNKYLDKQKSVGVATLFKHFVDDSANLEDVKGLNISLLVDKKGKNKDKIKKEFTQTEYIEKKDGKLNLSFFQCQFILIIYRLANERIKQISLFDYLKNFVVENKFDVKKLENAGFIQDNNKNSTINFVRFQRNDAAHSGKTLTKTEAVAMKTKVIDFFKLWISAKK